MSIWGKIVGAAGGFAVGGPIGAILGGIVGHAYDSSAKNIEEQDARLDYRQGGPAIGMDDVETKRVAFATALVILAAKLAKADGVVTKNEIRAFREHFGVSDDEVGDVAALFNEARRDAHGFEPYAMQIRALLGNDAALLEELLDGLFVVASADGSIHRSEAMFLASVAGIFGFSQRQFNFVAARYQAAFQRGGAGTGGRARTETPDVDDYTILGVARSVSDADLRTEYKKLVREHHPDRLTAKGLPEEMVKMANDKLAAINAAYDRVAKARGMN